MPLTRAEKGSKPVTGYWIDIIIRLENKTTAGLTRAWFDSFPETETHAVLLMMV